MRHINSPLCEYSLNCSRLCITCYSEIAVFLNIGNKPAFIKDVEHNAGDFVEGYLCAVGEILYGARCKIDLKIVAVTDPVRIADQNRKADVYGVPEEYSGHRFSHYSAHTGKFDNYGGMLAAGTQSKVLPRHDEVEGAERELSFQMIR